MSHPRSWSSIYLHSHWPLALSISVQPSSPKNTFYNHRNSDPTPLLRVNFLRQRNLHRRFPDKRSRLVQIVKTINWKRPRPDEAVQVVAVHYESDDRNAGSLITWDDFYTLVPKTWVCCCGKKHANAAGRYSEIPQENRLLASTGVKVIDQALLHTIKLCQISY